MSKELDNKVVAEARTSFGKGAARKIRAVGQIPAVLYGHGTDPVHLTLPALQVGLLLRKANAILDLQIEGKSQIALVKDVQKDPVKQIIEHLDLVIIKKGEKVQVEVPVHIEGEPFTGTVVEIELHTAHVEAEATHIPEAVLLNVEGANEGTVFHANQLVLPAGATLLTDPEAVVAGVHLPQKASDDVIEAETEAKAEAQAEAAAESADAAE